MRVDKSVIVLFRQMNLFLNRELLDEKLTSSDVLYLALLYEQDGRTQDEMAEAYTVDRAATTRSLQGLEKKGLVRREVDTFDRRIRRVYLTEKAMQYRTAIRRMADDLADALFEGMSEEEVKAFMEQVEAMGQRARRLNQRQERLKAKGIDKYGKRDQAGQPKKGQGTMSLARSRGGAPCGVWGNAPTVSRATSMPNALNKGAGSEASLPVTLRSLRSAPNLLYSQLAYCRAHWRDRPSQNKNKRQVQRISHTCRLFSPC